MTCARCGRPSWSPGRLCASCNPTARLPVLLPRGSVTSAGRPGPVMVPSLRGGLAALALAASVAVARRLLPSLLAWSGRRIWRALARRPAQRPVTLVEEIYIRRVRLVQ
ncbi:MAG: hypothetical protein HYY05_08170 [Chloroflexi bacterium]|nr:hypothetical protein [Chloroflexota bacterium]